MLLLIVGSNGYPEVSEWERCVVLQELFLSWFYRIENNGVSYMGMIGLAML